MFGFHYLSSLPQQYKLQIPRRTNVCVVCLSMSRCAPISFPMLLVCLGGLGTCAIMLVEQGIPSFKIPSTTLEQPKLLSHCIENTVLSQHGVPILLCHAHVTVMLTRMSVSLQIKSQKNRRHRNSTRAVFLLGSYNFKTRMLSQ